MTTLVKT